MLYSLCKRFVLSVLTILLMYSALGTFAARAKTMPVIGEINWAGSSLSTADEWIELWNLGDIPLSLQGYSLTGAAAQSIFFGERDVIPARSAFVVANYSASDTRSHLANPPSLVTSTISLSNDKMRIELKDVAGTVVDQAGDGTAPFAGMSGERKMSMLRRFPLLAGTLTEAWEQATATANLKAGALEFAQPGICERCVATDITDPEPETAVSSSEQTPPDLTPPPPLEEVTPVESTTADEETSSHSSEPTPHDATSPGTTSSTETNPLPMDENTSTVPLENATTDGPVATSETSSSTEVMVSIEDEPSLASSSSSEQNVVADESTSSEPSVSSNATAATNANTTESPQKPIAHLLITGLLQETSPIKFDGSSSTDPNGDPLTFAWDMGNGTVSTSSALTYGYPTSGTYVVTLTVSDSTYTDSVTTTLVIQPRPLIQPKLNEIFSAPSQGSEWIELYEPTIQQVDLLNGWSLADANGTIFSFSSSTQTQVTLSTPFIRVSLSSAKLNNTGDSVFLRNPQGEVVDEVTVPALAKDMAFARTASGAGVWQPTTAATPGTLNQIVDIAVEPSTQPTSTSSTTTTSSTSTEAETEETSTVTINTPTPIATTSSTSSFLSTKKPSLSSTTTSTKTTAAKTTAKKTAAATTKKTTATPVVPLITIEDIERMESNTRVTLTGVVATKPGILSQNQFVIQTTNGRGLLVKGNGKWISPPYQAMIQVTGTLVVNDQGASLQMSAKDQWLLLKEKATVSPRVIDLYAPSWEDGWSLVNVTGTIREVKGTTVHLDVDDTPIAATIRPVLNYRAARLMKGDVVQIQGIIDTRNETAKILPRAAEEITVIKQAEIVKPVAFKSTLPTWAPFGAAGATLALSQGVRRIQKVREQKRLTKLLRAAEVDLSTTP
jgi:PKD repeat protein